MSVVRCRALRIGLLVMFVLGLPTPRTNAGQKPAPAGRAHELPLTAAPLAQSSKGIAYSYRLAKESNVTLGIYYVDDVEWVEAP